MPVDWPIDQGLEKVAYILFGFNNKKDRYSFIRISVFTWFPWALTRHQIAVPSSYPTEFFATIDRPRSRDRQLSRLVVQEQVVLLN